MTSRVLLVSPAMTPALRQARFYGGDSIEDPGAARARAAAGSLPAPARVAVSPSARCRETARALGLDGGVEAPALRGVDVGRWRGRTLDEVTAAEPEALGHWLTDPAWAGHGGESVHAVCARVGAWLDGAAQGRTVAVVEPEIVRAAVVQALGLPAGAFWRLDVVPLTATELSGRAGRWNLRVGGPLAAPEG
ncbi:histidine phosphatase family protein [Streptomyces sp. SID8366]|uniref:histidine phosphatase family protein n=1 Tax=unclassified Streptomyces TaxID=2593676 RepID=UPI000DB90382|nr:histidine phosphatase family protein [Streptomyces sp. PsTaAH-130]MYU03729.1 histidine phosphatase family protein [Streptomyces sp. SID8366]RAJ57797.1 broad specificity phosphatase PhoE [Streptomyces sp. PsTaAH-130]